MYQLIYELLNNDRTVDGYGVFNFDTLAVEEYIVNDVKAMLLDGVLRNARWNNGIEVTDAKNLFPSYFKDYTRGYKRQPLYVVCKCVMDGTQGYLVLIQDCTLQFFTHEELVTLCKSELVTNVSVRTLKFGMEYPIVYGCLFRNIGHCSLILDS